jgi:hypothetical protein
MLLHCCGKPRPGSRYDRQPQNNVTTFGINEILDFVQRLISKEHNVSQPGALSENLRFLEYQTMNKAQKLSNPEYYAPSSEPFRIEMDPHM